MRIAAQVTRFDARLSAPSEFAPALFAPARRASLGICRPHGAANCHPNTVDGRPGHCRAGNGRREMLQGK